MTAVQTLDLQKKFKDKTAVDGLNLSVEEGELLALLGVNGAGKTTTIRMLCCLSKPTAGDALLLGKSIRKESEAVKAMLNLSPQETAVAPNLSVRENLELIAGLYGCDRKLARERSREIMAALSMEEAENRRAKTLSGGWQRRLSIAMGLITRPRILFLDEPTLGLDVLARRELWEVIRGLKGRVTVVLTTHYLEEAEALSDRIAVMAQGRLRAMGTAEELVRSTGAANFEDAFVALAQGKGERECG